jgi:F-type H+-transporting ATPase subunit a
MSAEAHRAQEGVKEVANWITVIERHWPDSPVSEFLFRWENVIFSFAIGLLFVAAAAFGFRERKRLPGRVQNLFEWMAESFYGLVQEMLGDRARQHIPFIGTLFFYILFQNLMGIVPGMKASTSNLNTTAALAVTVFAYVQWTALKENGPLGYLDHLMGNPRDLVGWILVPLNLPLHVLQEFIKPVSLALRLFGNILGEDALIAAFVGLGLVVTAFVHLPVGLPLQFPFMLLAIITGTIQALVFAILTTIYIALVLPHEHEHQHHEPKTSGAHAPGH